jgi:hypothetical protein
LVAGLLILSVSTFHDLASSLWQTDEAAHRPIILALVIWLIWDKRQIILAARISTGPVLASHYW